MGAPTGRLSEVIEFRIFCLLRKSQLFRSLIKATPQNFEISRGSEYSNIYNMNPFSGLRKNVMAYYRSGLKTLQTHLISTSPDATRCRFSTGLLCWVRALLFTHVRGMQPEGNLEAEYSPHNI